MAGLAPRDAATRSLVKRIRHETKRAVPDIDPDGPGGAARVLMLLSDPGEGGALKTGYLSPIKNPDPTAKNQRRLMSEAGLSPDVCVFWNGIPYDLVGRNPRSSDREHGARYLKEMIALLPNCRAIVAAGKVAQDVCRRAGVEAICVCHPSNRGLSGGVRGARPQRESGYRDGLKLAVETDGVLDVLVQNAVYRGALVPSPGVATYQVPGLPAGTYWVQNDDQAYVMNALLFVVSS